MPPKVDHKVCTGCRICYEECPLDVFRWDENKNKPIVAHPQECWHCGVCQLDCPMRAVRVYLPLQLW